MPKKTHIYRDFSGGENTSASPRVIKQNELQLVSGAMVDELGYLSSFYPPQKASATANLKDFTYTVSPGRGLFYFKSDYSYVASGDTADDGPYHYIMITDRSTGNISITDGTTKTEIGDINILTPDFYVHNNIVRIGNSEGASLSGGQKWFGPIGTSSAKSLLGITFDQRWLMMENIIATPFWGLVGRCVGDSKTMDDVQSINAPVKTDLAGTATVADNSGVVQFTSASHGMLDGDTVIISGSEYYSGSHIVANKATNTFEISKTWLSVAADETPEWRRKGEQDWFGGWAGGAAGATVVRGDAGITNAYNYHYDYVLWSDASTDELRIIDSLNSDNELSIRTNATSNTTAFKVYPPRTYSLNGQVLAGMNLDIYQSHGSDKGAWPPGEYEFGQTFVYEGNQESLIGKLHGNNITIDANEVIYIRVLISGVRDVSDTVPLTGTNQDLDPRLIGGRVYTRKAGTGDEWILLLDADFRTTDATSSRDLAGGGTRLNLTDKYDYWNVNTAGDGDNTIWNTLVSAGGVASAVAKWIGFYSTQYTIKSPSPFTYEAINGFSQDEIALSFGADDLQTKLKYQTSVLCNSRVFIANVDYYDTRNQSANLTKMGDAILYSPPNKVDTFPPSNRLDIAEGDGDEFTCLMESGGMLLAFKESTLYIVDVKNPNPAGWRLQGKFDGLGIKDTHSAVKIQSAIAFANNYGCWIYDNGQLKDLIQGKISVNQWQNWTRNKFRKFEFSGITTSTEANKLHDSGGTFSAAKSNILIGDKVFSTSGGEQISSANDSTFGGASNWTNAAGDNAFNAYDETTSGQLTVTPDDVSDVQYAYLDGAHWEDDDGASGAAMVAGRTYRLSYDIHVSAYTKGTLSVGMSNDATPAVMKASNTYTATNGSGAPATLDFVYVVADHEMITVHAAANTVLTADFDNFSIKEVGASVSTALVTAVDSDTELTLDTDIMTSGEDYYIESDTFGPNVGYDNISKKLIIVNDCQSISDSPRFYDLITGSWTRGWDNSPDKTGAALKTGVAYFMNGTESADWDSVNNSWTNFVTIPESSYIDTRGHNSSGAGAIVYVDEDMNDTNKRDLRWFAMKQKVIDYSTTDAAGDAGANRTRYNIVTRDEDFGAPNNIKKIYSISVDYITETGDENFAFDIRYQINGGLVTSDIGREWLELDSENFISANDDGVGTAQGNSINTYEIKYPEFSVNAFQSPLKCYSIALQINNKNEESGTSKRQYFKIVSIGIKYRIVGNTSQTDTGGFDSQTMVQSSS